MSLIINFKYLKNSKVILNYEIAMKVKKLEFDSYSFDLYEVHPGIFATISINKSASNAGFIDLGNHLIVFDTLMDPIATDDLIKAVKLFTNKEPSFIINSHFHLDHLYGNRKFSERIPIISSSNTLLDYHKNSTTELNKLKKLAPKEIIRLESLLKMENDKIEALEMQNDIRSWYELEASSFAFRPPDFIIDESILIHGTKRNVQIEFIGAAHTSGDLIAFFEEEKICFMGDLLFEKTDPSWASRPDEMPFAADPGRLRDILIKLGERDIEIYIPGHGDLCTKLELQQNIKFLEEYFLK